MAEIPAQHSIHQQSVGDPVSEGWYYFGVSIDTRKKLYVFLENAAELMTHDVATEVLNQKRKNNDTFHGYAYSAQQTDEQIKSACANGTDDDGVRRLTENELKQVEEVLERNQALRELALQACKKNNWVQSATTFGENGVAFQNISNGRVFRSDFCNGKALSTSLLLCRNEPG